METLMELDPMGPKMYYKNMLSDVLFDVLRGNLNNHVGNKGDMTKHMEDI